MIIFHPSDTADDLYLPFLLQISPGFLAPNDLYIYFSFLHLSKCREELALGDLCTVLELLNNLWKLGTELSYRPYTAWRYWFLGIGFWAPKKFKNSGSGYNLYHGTRG
jgi:hypothetical protein